MSTLNLISLILMASLYVIAGFSHFIKPRLYLKITPKWVPYPQKVNILVGILEIGLGVALLFSQTRSFAAVGIIALLLAVFPANIYHFQKAREKGKMVTATLLRLPLQAVLIYWAFSTL
jgi:uncharacterized membrane protein